MNPATWHNYAVGRGPIPDPPAGVRVGAERPILSQFPALFSLPFWLRNAPTTGATFSASVDCWYGIAEWRVPQDTRGQVAWIGTRATLGPCDPSPGTNDLDYPTAANRCAWGTTMGTGAALVIGCNLPATTGVWTSGPGTVPLVSAQAAVDASLQGGQQAATQNTVFHFATGNWGLSPLPTIERYTTTSPMAVILPDGARLQVALVVRSPFISGQTKSDGVVTRIYGEILLAAAMTPASFMV
jgi:hypothetical protein